MQTITNLLPHQAAAVAKTAPSRIGALFMEMGTGKSRTAIELVRLRRKRISKTIWFCPVSLKQTVKHEILKHTDTRPNEIHIFDHKSNMRTLPEAGWYIVGIESMSASKRVILTVNSIVDEKTFVILDESQYIKGHRSARTNWITDISKRARYRLILTGTPMSQGIVDLFSQMRFLSPKILGYRSFYSFAHNHLEYHPNYPGLIIESHNTEYIAAKIKPYVYQVTKEECLDLPDKLYETRYFEMTWEQREVYDQAKIDLLMDIDYDHFNSITIFRLFSALQQIVSGYRRRKHGEEWQVNYFIHYRDEMLGGIVSQIPETEKIIIWAKYRYDIDTIKAVLTECHGENSIALFHGGINEKGRADQVMRFRRNARFFIATPSCGGHGLTLNEAHHVIFYNNSFKYAERLQAEDRCHRIGQSQPVTYIDIVCAQSIDERIMTALSSKGNVVEAFKAEVDKVKGEGRKDTIKRMIETL